MAKLKSNKYYQTHPVEWAKDVLGVRLWSMQEDILNAIVHKSVVVKSGHGMGKDFLGAVIILWFLRVFENSKIITTAPSARQVEKVIWGEVSRLYYNALVPLEGKLMSQELRMSPSWYALGFTTKETNSVVGKAQGFHAPHQLVVITEAQAVDESIYEQLDGVLTSDHCRKYIAGNPLMAQGHFWRIFNDSKVGNEYEKFTFSCYDAPNVKERKNIFPGMVSYEWVEACRKKWGEDSALWEGRVLGQFPRVSVQTLLSMDECIRSTRVEKPSPGLKVLAIDPARFGDDSTGMSICVGGRQVYLNKESGKATTETEGEILGLVAEHNPQVLVIDEGCMGGGILDHVTKELESNENINIVTFNFGGRPTDSKFANIGTEAYFTVCENIRKGLIRLEEDQDLFNQLCSRKYGFSTKGQLIIESKKDMKKRGFPSPDVADATVMALFHSIGEEEAKTEEEEEEEDIEIAFLNADVMTKYPSRSNVEPMFL